MPSVSVLDPNWYLEVLKFFLSELDPLTEVILQHIHAVGTLPSVFPNDKYISIRAQNYECNFLAPVLLELKLILLW